MAGEGRLVYGGCLVSRWDGEPRSVIENGALYTEDGRIAAIGTYDDIAQALSARGHNRT